MSVRPYRFLTLAQRNHLTRAFSTVVEAWHSEWFGPSTPVPVSKLLEDFSQSSSATVRIYRGQDGTWVGISLEQWAEYWLAAALFDIEADDELVLGPVSSAVVDAALSDLARVAIQADIVDESRFMGGELTVSLPREANRLGSSHIAMNFSLRSIPVTLLVGSLAVEQQLGVIPNKHVPRNVVPVHLALGGRSVSARVELGSAILTAEDVLSLRIGDVVRIDKRVDQPIDLLIEGEHRLKGFLARTPNGKKCVRLVTGS